MHKLRTQVQVIKAKENDNNSNDKEGVTQEVSVRELG